MWGIGILLVAGLGVGLHWFFFMRGIVYSDDARFNGHMIDMAPTVDGRLTHVFVQEGNPIRKGETVFTIDAAVQQALVAQARQAVDAAKANLTVAKAKYERAVNGPRPEEIRSAEAEVLKLKSDEALAKTELDRIKALRREKAGTQEQLDRDTAAYESAKQNLKSAEQQLAMLKEGTRKDELAVAKSDVTLAASQVSEAKAALEKANRDLDLYTVKAPFNGYVVRRWQDPGAVIHSGQPVISVFDPSTLRVDANIEEKDLDDVAVGDRVDIHVDAYPHTHLQGRVTEILRAANSQFSLIPAQGVSGTFIKVTQRVPLRIALSNTPTNLILGPGLSVEVRIHSGTAPEQPHD
jgi:membrane fusion protein (multidrug efflux system)